MLGKRTHKSRSRRSKRAAAAMAMRERLRERARWWWNTLKIAFRETTVDPPQTQKDGLKRVIRRQATQIEEARLEGVKEYEQKHREVRHLLTEACLGMDKYVKYCTSMLNTENQFVPSAAKAKEALKVLRQEGATNPLNAMLQIDETQRKRMLQRVQQMAPSDEREALLAFLEAANDPPIQSAANAPAAAAAAAPASSPKVATATQQPNA